MKPTRVQLKRTRGWRMPANTVKVDRSTQWGNPFAVTKEFGAAEAVSDFRAYVVGRLSNGTGYPLDALRGKNLACWCRLDGSPCHADVLLELANAASPLIEGE